MPTVAAIPPPVCSGWGYKAGEGAGGMSGEKSPPCALFLGLSPSSRCSLHVVVWYEAFLKQPLASGRHKDL